MAAPPVDERVRAGLEALDRHAWRESYELLKAADADQPLAGWELEQLAMAAWWLGQLDDSIETYERAYAAYSAAGQDQGAAHIALELARSYSWKSAPTRAAGWLARASRLVEGQPDSPVAAELLITKAGAAQDGQDLESAEALATQAIEVARRLDHPDETALAMHMVGTLLAHRGEVAKGFELIDEATTMAVGGELSARMTGVVYCSTISLCHDLADFQRAGEWTDAATRWCERSSISGFPGVCRVHRAELLRLRGAWERATNEAAAACHELPGYNPTQAGAAFREMGEIQLRLGELKEAETSFQRAHELGAKPGPGIALLHLALGDTTGALASIRRSLEGIRDRIGRARLLPAQVEIAIAAGDLETAGAATDELAQLAVDFARPLFRAEAATAAGRMALARDEAAEAQRQLLVAVDSWNAVDAPYETAQVRVLLGQAYAAQGDAAGARLELQTAKSTFEKLAAVTAAAEATEHLEDLDQDRPGAATHRAYLFTDIVQSTNLVEVIGDQAWSALISWHDRALRNLFRQHGARDVESRGDGFFATFEGVKSATSCAIDIQRTLAEHRQEHGFAPKVRIGLHVAHARKVRDGYHGVGVHVAARIAALAEGDQILASTASLAGHPEVRLSGERAVSLKGIAEPVEVASVEWR